MTLSEMINIYDAESAISQSFIHLWRSEIARQARRILQGD